MKRENNVLENCTYLYTYDGLGNLLRKHKYTYSVGGLTEVQNEVRYSDTDAMWEREIPEKDIDKVVEAVRSYFDKKCGDHTFDTESGLNKVYVRSFDSGAIKLMVRSDEICITARRGSKS